MIQRVRVGESDAETPLSLVRYPPLLKLAIQLLQSPTVRRMPTRVAGDVEELPKQSVAVNLRPQIGVMVTSDTRESEKHHPLLSNGGFQTNEC